MAVARLLFGSLLVLQLIACQMQPSMDNSTDVLAAGQQAMDSSPGTDVEGTEQQNEGNESVVRVSPYQKNKPEVSSAAKQRFQEAIVAMQSEDWSSAEVVLKKLVNDYPRLSGPLLNLGIVQEVSGRDEEAEASYRQAIKVNANNLHVYHRCARLLREQGRFAEAESMYLAALSMWQGDAVSHRNLAILYDIYMGRLDEALHHYQQYMKLAEAPDREVKGWVADLNRRLKTVGAVAVGQTR